MAYHMAEGGARGWIFPDGFVDVGRGSVLEGDLGLLVGRKSVT